jgi:NAD(P)-dependent dehydrogenase (short-subunit alcohol dehydrogenase family)
LLSAAGFWHDWAAWRRSRTWQWAVLECVSNGPLLARIGLHDLAAGCLRGGAGAGRAAMMRSSAPVRAREIWGPRRRAMHAIPRAGQPEEIGEAAAYLASDAASFMMGQCLTLDGG